MAKDIFELIKQKIYPTNESTFQVIENMVEEMDKSFDEMKSVIKHRADFDCDECDYVISVKGNFDPAFISKMVENLEYLIKMYYQQGYHKRLSILIKTGDKALFEFNKEKNEIICIFDKDKILVTSEGQVLDKIISLFSQSVIHNLNLTDEYYSKKVYKRISEKMFSGNIND